MNLSVSDVENYLEAVKCAVKAHRYRLDMNAKRPDNRKLFDTYLLTCDTKSLNSTVWQ